MPKDGKIYLVWGGGFFHLGKWSDEIKSYTYSDDYLKFPGLKDVDELTDVSGISWWDESSKVNGVEEPE